MPLEETYRLPLGHKRSNIPWLRNNSQSDIDDKTSLTVEEVLRSKHPPLRNVEPSFLETFDTVPDFLMVVITGDDVEKVARKLRGSAGLANFDAIMMRNLLLQHGQASQTLREAFATFSTWMATENVPWAVYRGFMMSRMVGLGKPDGGVRPVGIGDINRRFVAKIILSVTGEDATEACSSDQLCAGLKFGCEGGVHGMTAAFDVDSANEDVGFMLVDADIAFNLFSRIQMLWNVRHAWPAGAWFAFNCYKHWSLLMVREPGGCLSAIINSREGVTQGDPFAMVMYAIGTLPLIRRVRKQAIDAKHSWYADDSSVVGRFPDLKRVYTALCMWGVNYGYIPNSSKTKIIVPETRLAAAQQYFNTESRLNFEVQSGARYLGGFVGSTSLRDAHVEAKISDWVYAIERLALVAKHRRSQSAFSGLTKVLQHQWTYLQRVTPGIDDLFAPVEAALSNVFLPALYGGDDVTEHLRAVTCLPVKFSGLGIPDPVSTAPINLENSRSACSLIIAALQNRSKFKLIDHCQAAQACRIAQRKLRDETNEGTLNQLLLSAPLSKGMPDVGRILERGRDTGHWLSTPGSAIGGTIVGNQEWQDAIRMRSGLLPNNLPSKCDGCDAKFTLGHALSCKFGGPVHRRHDDVSYELKSLAAIALGVKSVRTEPLINPGSASVLKSKRQCNDNDTVTSIDDLRGDIIIKGLFERNQDCIIDVRVTDTDAPSYRTRNPYSVIKSQEAEKKKKYLRLCLEQRRTFVPFVVSVDGIIGREGRSLLKQITLRLADKWKKPQSVVAGIVRSRMSFAILRATNYCIRGSRTPFHKVSREIQWDGGSGTALYEISED